MRTGAIFARGSCRALKWMALLGLVFVLGAGQSLAQQKPNKPGLTVKGKSATEVTLTWTVPAGGPAITSFVTQDNATGSFTATEPTPDAVTGGSTVRTVDISGATAGTPKYYRVGAVNAAGTTWSDTKSFTTEQAPAQIPTADFVVAAGDQAVTLTWTRADRARYYEYNYKVGSTGDFSSTADTKKWKRVAGGSGATRVAITGLKNGTAYLFGLRAVNNGGSTGAESTKTATPSGKPGAPTALTATLGTPSAGKVSVTLNWTAPENNGGNPITDYEYEIVGFRPWTLTRSANTFFDISGLDAGKAAGYTYRVRAVNANGVGPFASTDPADAPTGPTTPTGDTTGQIKAITIGGAMEKTTGGVKRMHVTEGAASNMVTVMVEWTADQLRTIWAAVPAGSKPTGVTVMLDMMPAMVPSLAWVSEAETEAGHDDVTIGAGLVVEIPAMPATGDRAPKSASGSASIAFNRDADAENEAFYIEVTNAGAFDAGSKTMSDLHVIDDSETQGITLMRVGTGVVYEGGPNISFEVKADPPRVDLDLQVRFDLEDVTGETVASRENTLDKAVGTISTGATAKETVTLTLDGNDMNRTDDKIKLQAEVVDYARDTGAYTGVGEKEHEIEVIDVHRIPPTTVMPKTVDAKEGTKTTLTYTVNRNPRDTIAIPGEVRRYTSEPLKLTVMAKDKTMEDDYRIMVPMITIPMHGGKAPWTQEVKVEVEIHADDDLGMEALMLDATVEGTVAGNGPPTPQTDPEAMATINIEDATVKLVEAKPQADLDAAIKAAGADAALTVDDMVTIMGSALFDSVDGATVIYSATSSDAMVASAMTSGGEIMITAKGKGDVMITVEASASMASGVKANPQTEPDRASVEIPISVALAPLSIMLEGPDAGMNLVEGMEYTITAKANRAVEMDTMVELVQTDGTAAPADYKVEPITIMTGESIGTTKLMVEEDGMMENEGNMAEMLTLEGRVGAMKTTNSLMFYLWDAAVPALPVIAQLLLAAFLALGGYRRYLRR